MSIRDANRLAAALLCVGAAVGASVLAARVLVPDTAPARPAIAITGADADADADTSAAPAVAPIAQRLAHASAGRGATLAAANCSGCHTLEQGAPSMVGPNLFGVVDRPVAAEAGFGYSDALKALGGRWSVDRLDRWLLRPQAMAPGTLMGFAGLVDPDQRADLIAFLRKQAPAPAATLPGPSPGTPAPATATGASPAAFEMLVDHADAKRGADVAAAQCGACHGFDQGGGAQVGPNLFGVSGRGIAQGADFHYSTALSAHHGTWTAAALGDWLLDPKRFAPGTRMGFAGIADPATRAAVVAYLRTLHP